MKNPNAEGDTIPAEFGPGYEIIGPKGWSVGGRTEGDLSLPAIYGVLKDLEQYREAALASLSTSPVPRS